MLTNNFSNNKLGSLIGGRIDHFYILNQSGLAIGSIDLLGNIRRTSDPFGLPPAKIDISTRLIHDYCKPFSPPIGRVDSFGTIRSSLSSNCTTGGFPSLI